MSRRRLKTTVLAAGAALALAGCQSTGKKVVVPPPPEPVAAPAPVPILVMPSRPPAPPPPAPKSCVPRNLPAPPRYPDTDAALRNSAGAADRYQLMAAGRILRTQRLEDLERVVQNCR